MHCFTRLNLAGVILASAMVAACGGREEAEVPQATTETHASRQPNQPTTVTGCLRAGDASDTYVLTTAETTGGPTAANYHLTGTGTVNLQDHLGYRVQVSGVVEAQSQIATHEAGEPAANTTGTAGKPGTPTVQTGTQLSIQRIDVNNIRRVDGECRD